MSVLQLVFRVSDSRLAPVQRSGVGVRPVCPTSDVNSISRLVEVGHGGDGPRPTVGGLLAEIVGRPGRSVAAWLATVDGNPAGLVALVAADVGPATRHSIAWLFVAERSRRRGVGRTLVATAIGAAVAAGAREVWAETRADWPTASAFWAAVGFRPVS